MTLNIEGIVYGGLDVQELFGIARRFETLLFSLSPSDRLVRVLRTIVHTLIIDFLSRQAEGSNRDMIGSEFIGCDPGCPPPPCFFNNFRINFNVALAFRLDCTRKSKTSPSLSTARHNQ